MTRSTRALCLMLTISTCNFLHADTRTHGGTGNNLANSTWGATNARLLRVGAIGYADGTSSMVAAPARVNPRTASNNIVSQSSEIANRNGLTNFVWQWGQFVDHDLDLTENAADNGIADVSMLPGDPLGPAPMPFSRSHFDPTSGTSAANPRQQINQITSYMDGSNVYGSDDSRALWLRTQSQGHLKMSPNELLPYNDGTQVNAGMSELNDFSTDFFLAGDIRANEQPGLTSMHTIFVREHNRLADLLAQQAPAATDEELYQAARRIVGAEIQSITYNEFLPALLGSANLPAYSGYDSQLDATVANEFATAFFRFGHTMLIPNFQLIEDDGSLSGTLPMRDSFFAPTFIGDDPNNLDRVLRGLTTLAQEIDHLVVDDVRNFLFGPPGAGGFDLATLNIQRGRDHGLPDYNALREAYGLLAKEKFLTDGVLADGMTPNGLTSDPDVAAAFALTYDSIDNVDPWLASLAEDHLPGSAVGELIAEALGEQFGRTRDGDRFFLPERSRAAGGLDHSRH